MIKSKDVMGLPLINLNDGNQIGKISDIVVDNTNRKIAFIELSEKSGLFKKTESFIEIENVYNIGTDAVTVEKLEFKHEIPKELANFKLSDLMGRKMILENGTVIGKLGDVNFALPDGKISSILITETKNSIFSQEKGQIEISNIRAIGKDAIIVYNQE